MFDFINIRVTEAELDLITCLLEQAGTMEDSTGQPAFELLHDLMEQAARPDEWTEDLDPTDLDGDLTGRTFEIAEDHFIQAGIDAREQLKEKMREVEAEREQAKATSRAADRRAQRFGEFEVQPEGRELSETQKHDLWSKPSNDPADW